MYRMYITIGMNKTWDIHIKGDKMVQKNLQSELIDLYNKTAEYAKKFQKKTYEADMDNLKMEYNVLLCNVRDAYEESDEAFLEVASYIPSYVADSLAQIPSKRKRDLACLDYNMNMVSYFVPLLGEITSIKSKEFTEKMVEIWNQKMPDNKIGHSTRDNIQGGFKKGILCYVTTAVCKSLEKPDDCYELTLLRDYRDEYLLLSEEGTAAVEEYYNIAPTIVKRINKKENAAEIYNSIWLDYLNPCVHLIEEGRKDECRKLYSDMVYQLEKKYLYS